MTSGQEAAASIIVASAIYIARCEARVARNAG